MRVKVSISVLGMTSVGEHGSVSAREVFLDLPRLPDMSMPQSVYTHDAVQGMVNDAMERALSVVRDECYGAFGVPLVGQSAFVGATGVES